MQWYQIYDARVLNNHRLQVFVRYTNLTRVNINLVAINNITVCGNTKYMQVNIYPCKIIILRKIEQIILEK